MCYCLLHQMCYWYNYSSYHFFLPTFRDIGNRLRPSFLFKRLWEESSLNWVLEVNPSSSSGLMCQPWACLCSLSFVRRCSARAFSGSFLRPSPRCRIEWQCTLLVTSSMSFSPLCWVEHGERVKYHHFCHMFHTHGEIMHQCHHCWRA